MSAPEAEPLVGTFRGDLEGLDAAAKRVEVYCGPKQGWRPLGERVSPACCIIQAYGQMMAGPSYHVAEAGA